MSSSRRSLLLFVSVLLFGTVVGSAPTYRRQRAESIEGWVFFSPNTRSGLTYEGSIRGLLSPEQQRGKVIVPGLLHDLGLPSAKVHDAIGDWDGGVENSLLVQLPNIRDPATLRYAAAWLGLSCRQQAVLLFHARVDGSDRLTILDVKAPVDEVRRRLDGFGIRDRTLVVSEDGCRIFVVDPRGEQQERLEQAARSLGGRMASQPGRAEVLAGSTRDAATKEYRSAMWTWRVSARR